jgi:hypothetical protein
MDRDALATGEQEIITECQERFGLAQEAETDNREQAVNDLKFGNGDQWEPYLRDERFSDQRPCLTINITDAMVRRVINACRQNRPRIKVHPVGDGADIQTAKLEDGLIRHIENLSGADHAYDCAVESAIRGGQGWIGLDHDFIDEKSFDQELEINAYPNPFMCYADPDSRAPDGSDMQWFIEREKLKRTDYKARFGEIDASWNFTGKGDNISDWSDKECIYIAKYWRIERVKDEAWLIATPQGPQSVLKSEIEKKKIPLTGLMIAKKRDTERKRVMCYLLSPTRILGKLEWPGKHIPRFPVYGRRLDVNGKVSVKGMIRDLKDPARMYNYAQTAKTEAYALQPKAPWLIAEGQMEGHESAWRDANRKPIVALPYKPTANPDGSVTPPPQRQVPPQPNAGFAEWGDSTRNDFLAVAGMPHDPGQDTKGEVVSGIALRKREGISDVSHYDFYDNLTRTLRHLGRCIVDVVPYFYDTPRMQRIIRDDGTPETVMINEKTAEGVKNNLSVGRYDVYVDTGPSYQTKREESAEALLELITGTGKMGEMLAQSAADKVMRQFDFPDSDAIADRLISLIPAAQAEKQMGDMTPDQLKGMVAGLQAQLKQANQKGMALELELQSKHGLEQIKQRGETERTLIETRSHVHDTNTRANTAIHDTHVKAQTAINVAEIHEAGQLLNTNTEAAHDRAAAKEMVKAGETAEKKAE